MSGYKLRLILYTNTETWREIEIPDDISFLHLDYAIKKLFGFKGYHMSQFKVPEKIPEEEAVDLNSIVETIEHGDFIRTKISKLIEKHDILVYEYDFGDGWEIIIHKQEKTDYKNKTALITDYKGKYNPRDDIGGPFVFDEIMEVIDNEEDLEYVLDEYGLTKDDLDEMNFENTYKKGSRIRLNDFKVISLN